MRIETVEFVKSAYNPNDLISSEIKEIVFAGRSNVGKSSLINTLLRRKNIAKTSSTPGKTISVNYLMINSDFYFVDLPGYGYARAPKKEKDRWYKLVEAYFHNSKSIAVIVHLIDARRGIVELDRELDSWLESLRLPFILTLTKSDKMKRAQLQKMVNTIRKESGNDVPVIPASSHTGLGIKELWSLLIRHLLS